MSISGYDEAGRGPVIGPLVVAGVKISKNKEKELIKLGVKDSKQLSPGKREVMFNKIKQIADSYEIIIISPKQLNQMMDIMNLNQIEMNAMAIAINKLDSDKAFIDLPSNSKYFSLELKGRIKNQKTELIAEHKADEKYPVVSAASILAKVTRDKEIEKIKKKYNDYGDIGSGYPSDERTINFLKNYLRRNKKLPEETRTKWQTVERILEEEGFSYEKKQKTLFSF